MKRMNPEELDALIAFLYKVPEMERLKNTLATHCCTREEAAIVFKTFHLGPRPTGKTFNETVQDDDEVENLCSICPYRKK